MPDILSDPFGWILTGLVHAIFGSGELELAGKVLDDLTSRFFAIAGAGDALGLDSMCPPCRGIDRSLRPLGLLGLGVAVLARIVRLAVRCRTDGISPIHLLADVGIRLVCGVAALGGIYDLLNLLSAQSMTLAGALVESALRIAQQGAHHPTLVRLALDAPLPDTGRALATLLVAAFLGYLVLMVLASRAALLFTVLAAPFAVPALVYAEESHLVLLWLRMLLFSLAVPAAAVLCLSFTVLLLTLSAAVPAVGGALMVVSLMAGMWLSVKVIHGLMGAAVQHAGRGVGGTLGAVGMGPAARSVARIGEARPHLGRPVRFAAGAALFGPGIRSLVKVPARGGNLAFDMFVAQRLLHAGISSLGGDDLPERRLERLRTYYWARYLAQEILPGRPGEAAA
jgi:hypothetical protein